MSLFPPPKPQETFCNKDKDCSVSGLEEMPDRLARRFVEQHHQMLKVLDDLKLPKKGEQLRLVTLKSFNAVSFIEHIIAKHGGIKHMCLVVYSINFYAGKRIVELVEKGSIQRLDILMSNLRNKAHREKEQVLKDMMINASNITLFFCSSHAKIFSCATTDGHYYTFEGSGNMSSNSRLEQYVIDNDKGMYVFTKTWMQDVRKFLKGKKELVDYG